MPPTWCRGARVTDWLALVGIPSQNLALGSTSSCCSPLHPCHILTDVPNLRLAEFGVTAKRAATYCGGVTALVSSPLAVVNAMISAIEARDIDAAVALLSEDISYENMPMKPMTGRSVVAKVLQGFLTPAEEVDWQIISEIERDDTVFNERLDRFKINGQWLELPIAGVFKVREGKIVLWRDYFDMATYSDQLKKITSST